MVIFIEYGIDNLLLVSYIGINDSTTKKDFVNISTYLGGIVTLYIERKLSEHVTIQGLWCQKGSETSDAQVLAEKHQRSGSHRTVESYSRMLQGNSILYARLNAWVTQ